MWGPLIEKAFAKLNVCYEFLIGGEITNAIVDMTGGVHESFQLSNTKGPDYLPPDQMWNLIYKSMNMKSLCGASIQATGAAIESINSNGLVASKTINILKYFIFNSSASFELRRWFPWLFILRHDKMFAPCSYLSPLTFSPCSSSSFLSI